MFKLYESYSTTRRHQFYMMTSVALVTSCIITIPAGIPGILGIPQQQVYLLTAVAVVYQQYLWSIPRWYT